MRPLQARCHLGLAELYAKGGNARAARAELTAADELFAAMDDARQQLLAPPGRRGS
jgi:hypothetical protein